METINSEHTDATRRQLLKVLAALGITGPLALDLVAQSRTRITTDDLRNASAIIGEKFSDERLKIIQAALQRNLDQFQIVRDFEVDDLIEPAPMFIATRHAAPALALAPRTTVNAAAAAPELE